MIQRAFIMKYLNLLMTLKTYTLCVLPFITLLHEYCHLFGTATNKIRRKKKGQAIFLCHARSTLEAAVAEIINETRSCDLSKWTGNKPLLIGPSRGWRQGGGLWFPFSRGQGSGARQVSGDTLAEPAPGDRRFRDQRPEGSSATKKNYAHVSVFTDTV